MLPELPMTVLVLDGNENQAVAAVRSLARAGHRVLVGAETTWSKAGWSRYAAGTFVYTSPEIDVDAFVARLADVTRDCGGAFLMPMTERTLLPLSRERARLVEVGAIFVVPAHDRVREACSKEHTTNLARSLGIAVPRTWSIADDPVEAKRLSVELPYPVVLKPAMSHEPGDRAMRSTGAPAYAKNGEEFLQEWRRIAARARAIVVQEFVTGSGAGYFALVRDGEPVLEFAHRRVRDVRPTGSGSAVRESAPLDPVLRDASRRLLGVLEWHGVAMVEFRIRPDGTPVFLEVNGRFWTSLPLAIAAGVDFPRHLVELGTTGKLSRDAPYRVGVRCRWWLGDFRHLVQVWRGAPNGYPAKFPGRLATLVAFLTPRRGTVHDNFWWSDPLPELGDWLHFFGRKLPGHVLRHNARSTFDAQGRAAHP
jgi:predicted ATP-grasp superfamily ATP-dependent carboligase